MDDYLERLEKIAEQLETSELHFTEVIRKTREAHGILEDMQGAMDRLDQRLHGSFVCRDVYLGATCPHCKGTSFLPAPQLFVSAPWVRMTCKNCKQAVVTTTVTLPFT